MKNVMKILVPAMTIIILFAASRSFAKEPAIGFCKIEQFSIEAQELVDPKIRFGDLIPKSFKKFQVMGAIATFHLPTKTSQGSAKLSFDLVNELPLFKPNEKVINILENLINKEAIPDLPDQIKLFITNCGQ